MEERRYTPDEAHLEDRDGKPPVITGYAAVFNSLSQELPLNEGRTFREVIRPGAFAEALTDGSDVLARFEHAQILGRTKNGTLRLSEDHRGLRYAIDPPDTSLGRDVVTLIKRGDIPYSSFAFKVKKGGDSWNRQSGSLVREIRAVVLIDVSPVAQPAYLSTDVAVRSLIESNIDPVFSRFAMRLALAERT